MTGGALTSASGTDGIDRAPKEQTQSLQSGEQGPSQPSSQSAQPASWDSAGASESNAAAKAAFATPDKASINRATSSLTPQFLAACTVMVNCLAF